MLFRIRVWPSADRFATDANSRKDECLIGSLSEEGIKAMEEDAKRAAKELAKVKEERKGLALQPDVFTQAKLVKRKEVSSDTRYVSHVYHMLIVRPTSCAVCMSSSCRARRMEALVFSGFQ